MSGWVRSEIVAGLRRRIQTGSLPPKAELPSIRSLAKSWGTSTRTIERAFADLRKEGLITDAEPGIQPRVLAPPPAPKRRPESAWRAGERTPEARKAHNAQTTEWRRQQRARQVWSPAFTEDVLQALAAEPDPSLVMRERGFSATTLYARMRTDQRLAALVESLLAVHCPAGEACGTTLGYEVGGRCAGCRRAHRGSAVRKT